MSKLTKRQSKTGKTGNDKTEIEPVRADGQEVAPEKGRDKPKGSNTAPKRGKRPDGNSSVRGKRGKRDKPRK